MSVSSTSRPITPSRAAEPRPERIVVAKLWRVGALTAVVAAAVNLLIRAGGLALFDISPAFDPLKAVGPVVAASTIGVVGATVALALLARFSPRPLRRFRMVAAVGLLLSLGGPLSARSEEGSTTAAIGILIVMHLITAALAVGFLTTLPRKAEAAGQRSRPHA